MSVRIINEDCLVALPRLAAEGVRAHACITDPPYHLTSIVKRFGRTGAAPAQHGTDGAFARASKGFMGKTWDGGDIAFRPATWVAVKACLLPGAHLVAFGGTKGWHRMACAIEDAGFEIRDTIMWLYGSGMPHSHNIGKALGEQPETASWKGWGSALKPAVEPIVLARVPLSGTLVANTLAHGCGGLNIAAATVGDEIRENGKASSSSMCRSSRVVQGYRADDGVGPGASAASVIGRWPANLAHDGSDEVEAAFAAFGERTTNPGTYRADSTRSTKIDFAAARCAGTTTSLGDTGSASRFFFSAKADAADRAESKHPTVKPTDLMRWLAKLVCPPGGTILDPFAGTGSTGLAADQLGMDAILVEQDATYAADARRKITRDAGMFAQVGE